MMMQRHTTMDKCRLSGMQLRSVIDVNVDRAPDCAWAKMLTSEDLVEHSSTKMQIALPKTEEAETRLLDVVVALADALGDENAALAAFYRCWGWAHADEYFAELGTSQVMVVDVDHNDLDDRLAILLLAWQMASANTERRRRQPSADHKCTLYLDVRTYEGASGSTIWRTLRLAVRVCAALPPSCGLELRLVCTDSTRAIALAADYLGVRADVAALEECAAGVGRLLQNADGGGEPHGGCCRRWCDAVADSEVVSLWLLGGLCATQLADMQACLGAARPRWNIFEQATPAWQSMAVQEEAAVQPSWRWPPASAAALAHGWGAEPSNIRSSEASYEETIRVYLRFQQLVEQVTVRYVVPALARVESFLPSPPGEPMIRVAGRPLLVRPPHFTATTAVDVVRVEASFARLAGATQVTQLCPLALPPKRPRP